MLEIVRVENVTAFKDTVALSVNVTIWHALVTTVAYVAVSKTPSSFYVRLSGVSQNNLSRYIKTKPRVICNSVNAISILIYMINARYLFKTWLIDVCK